VRVSAGGAGCRATSRRQSLAVALLYCPALAAEPHDDDDQETPMLPNHRELMFAFAALGGCATP